MGRRKVEITRIQDKSSRVVTFSKRRAGLFKKARQISVLCDVDVAVIVFSDRGKLYEVCSGRRTKSIHNGIAFLELFHANIFIIKSFLNFHYGRTFLLEFFYNTLII